MRRRTLIPFDALPAYLGGKRRLAPLIFALLGEAVPRGRWPSLTLLDPFLGGGAVSLYAKSLGLRVIANDLARRSELVGQALIANSSTKLSRADVIDLLREPRDAHPHLAEERCHPRLFTLTQARLLDRALANARARRGVEAALAELLMVKWVLRSFPMSTLQATDAPYAVAGDWDRISPHRLAHYARGSQRVSESYLLALAEELNAGVMPGCAEMHRLDAREFLSRTHGDVAYLDPPYAGTTGYGRHYRMLDELLGDEDAHQAEAPTLENLLDAARCIPVIILSYGSVSRPLVEVEALCQQHGREVLRSLEIPYAHLRSLASPQRNETNREYLVLAVRR